MSRFNRRVKCLTLVELLTALSITVLLLAVSIPIFTRQAKANNVDASARVVEGAINRARNFAFNPNKEFPVKYSVYLQNGLNERSIEVVIEGYYRSINDQTGALITENIDRIAVDGVVISSVAPVSIDFKPLSGEVVNSLNLPIIIKSANADDTKTITVNSLGNAEVK